MAKNLTRNQKRAAKWAASHNERAQMVAACPHCPKWFKTTVERNAHRASLPRTPKHRAEAP